MSSRRSWLGQSTWLEAPAFSAAFARSGYSRASIDAIAERARVTRGALYHHFEGKKHLFRAVFEEAEREVLERVVAAAAAERDPSARILSALAGFFDACRESRLQRILLEEGPSVLGWETWREIDQRYALGAVLGGLADLAAEGEIDPQVDHTVAAHLILACAAEAVMVIARAADPDATRRRAEETLKRFIASLRPSE